MARRKKLINNSGIPQHEIEYIAQCILPDIIAFYESEEGQKEHESRGVTELVAPLCHYRSNIQRMVICHIVQILPDVVM